MSKVAEDSKESDQGDVGYKPRGIPPPDFLRATAPRVRHGFSLLVHADGIRVVFSRELQPVRHVPWLRGWIYPWDMCRNIRTLHNFEPAATSEEVHAAALQYVRKISGTTKPSRANQEAFDRAVDEIGVITERLLAELTTSAQPKDRDEEAAKAKERSARRFATA